MPQKETLREMIREKVIVRSKDKRIIQGDKKTEGPYVFDFKRILLVPEVLEFITNSLLEKIASYKDIQIGGMESAAIPLITSLILRKKVPGFYMRKSRKKSGLMNQFEGDIHPDKPVILVDDIINSGNSILKQIIALENEGIKVTAILCILIFHSESWYEELQKRNIKIYSLISHDEISLELGIPPVNHRKDVHYSFTTFSPIARFATENPSYNIEFPRPTPYFDGEKLYFGMDDGVVYALDGKTLEVVWKYQTSFGEGGKRILGSCSGNGRYIFFGAYDGNFYALDAKTGKLGWKDESANWIGSSPCYIASNNSVCVGMEYAGNINQGGITLFDADTGKIIWSVSSPKYTHGSPIYCKKYNSIFFGSNDGLFYRIDLESGNIVWIVSTDSEIKSKPVLSEDEEMVLFGAGNGILYGIQTKTGKEMVQCKAQAAIHSVPFVEGERVYFASLDKCIYAFDYKRGELIWFYATGGRIFASPVVHNGKLYCGSNDGSLYIIDAEGGVLLKKWVGVERIVSPPVFLSENNFVIRTISNEIYLF